MKRAIIIYLLLTLSSVVTLAQSNKIVWNFDNRQPLKSSSGLELSWRARKPTPELVKGISGSGLRTDGYSTQLDAVLPISKSNSKSIAGYFALETYPTDTAAFFAFGTRDNSSWVSAAIDRFGHTMLGIHENGVTKYYPSETKISTFTWSSVTLNIKPAIVELFINGKLAKSAQLTNTGLIEKGDSLLVMRDWRIKKNGNFPTNYLNGIVDQLVVQAPALNGVAIKNLAIGIQSKVPVLAVVKSRFQGDFSRPAYHLLPAANWTNETHGLIFYKNKYHIFNQKNGSNLFLGQMNWGHFSSPDLIHWTEEQPALKPEQGYDQNGIWSGHVILNDKGIPLIVYTGGGEGTFGMCLASPLDEALIHWKKDPTNPVIKAVPEGFVRKDFHDPYVFKEGNTWYMIVGFGLKESKIERGSVLLYKSLDLKKWTYLHPLYSGDPANDDSGVFWEMPIFWKLNGKYILLVNKVPNRGKPAVALYWTGDFIDEKFVPDDSKPKRLEVINRLLSPSVANDRNHNTVAIGIIPDETSSRETYARGWTHLFSIPRIWKLNNGKVIQTPHPSINQLRANKISIPGKTIDTASNFTLSSGKQQIEIIANILPGTSKQFGFIVGANKAGTEFSKIYFDLEKHQLIVDQTKSSLKKYVPLQTRTGAYNLDPNKVVNIHLFIDGSVIEGFINNEDAFTTRIFPLNKDSNIISLFTQKGNIKLLNATVWQMKSAVPITNF